MPFALLVGAYLLAYGGLTGDFHTGSNIRSYFTFEYAQGWVYIDRYPSGGAAYLQGIAEARRLYGTPEENRHSVLRAIRRNPVAFAQRVGHLLRQVPGLATTAYGGPGRRDAPQTYNGRQRRHEARKGGGRCQASRREQARRSGGRSSRRSRAC